MELANMIGNFLVVSKNCCYFCLLQNPNKLNIYI
jgi:hypothetical protein